jgi:hypothetical protein
VTDRVHPAVHTVQAARPDALLDRGPIQTCGRELSRGDDAVLSSSQLGELNVNLGTFVCLWRTNVPRLL